MNPPIWKKANLEENEKIRRNLDKEEKEIIIFVLAAFLPLEFLCSEEVLCFVSLGCSLTSLRLSLTLFG